MARLTQKRRAKGAPDAAWLPLGCVGLIVAGFAVAVGAIWFDDFQRTHGTVDLLWVRFTAFSGITAAVVLMFFGNRWYRVWFWMTFVVAMAARTVLYVAVLRKYPNWRVGVFTGVEVPTLIAVLHRLNYRASDVAQDRLRRRLLRAREREQQ
jgi:hypothetical protein